MEELKGKYLVTKKVTVEKIYDEIVGVFKLGDLYNIYFAGGGSRLYTEAEVAELLNKTDDNSDRDGTYISDVVDNDGCDAKVYLQASSAFLNTEG